MVTPWNICIFTINLKLTLFDILHITSVCRVIWTISTFIYFKKNVGQVVTQDWNIGNNFYLKKQLKLNSG